jgi:hypothetical protein
MCSNTISEVIKSTGQRDRYMENLLKQMVFAVLGFCTLFDIGAGVPRLGLAVLIGSN